ncbi:hypothetical protein ES703_77304 [subsurface metagenome]
MIDDTVKMALKEARARNIDYPSVELYEFLKEISNKVWTSARKNPWKERRQENVKEDEEI